MLTVFGKLLCVVNHNESQAGLNGRARTTNRCQITSVEEPWGGGVLTK